MAVEYHDLSNVVEIKNTGDLTIPRAKALVLAILRQREYTLVQLFKFVIGNAVKLEYVTVDVECHVPPKNAYGIKCPERLALCIPVDPKQLVEVLALRKDFPVTMHQNQGVPGSISSLCLYFEPPAVVFRTWTPQNFLRRIHWWIDKTATGELHPSDQPVEHLFFASKYELVLPSDIDALRRNQTHRFLVSCGPPRPDQGITCFLHGVPKDTPNQKGQAAPLELYLPPVVHGVVERDPETLGQLADILDKRGVNLITSLRSILHSQVDEKGVAATPDEKIAVLLLHIPIRRTEGAEPVGISHRAFLMLTSALKLGETIGALFLEKSVHQNAPRYFQDLMNDQTATHWREEKVFAMDVLRFNDAEAARKQSGIADQGPTGAVVGVGSLGSFLLNLWTRNGWGQWTVIDHDYIKPHNLSRHTAYSQHIGIPKTVVVSDLQAAATNGTSTITPINADATDFSQPAIRNTLTFVELVIDASTTLEYPRAASLRDTFARHISVFIAPNGNAAVLLSEDAKREMRLRTLEAQYYRALINEDWGRDHLTGNGRTFWSGASCRDISTVMSYSRITGHASTLAEQIPIAAGTDEATICVWQRNPRTGSVVRHDVRPAQERCMTLGAFNLFIDNGLEQQLRDLRTKSFPNETGGVLLGYYDLNISMVVIVACLPAPSDSRSSTDSFERGIDGLMESVNEAADRTSGIVTYIGEWHSHPPGHSASPSRDDITQLSHLAAKMAEDGLPAVQLIIGETSTSILQGTVPE